MFRCGESPLFPNKSQSGLLKTGDTKWQQSSDLPQERVQNTGVNYGRSVKVECKG